MMKKQLKKFIKKSPKLLFCVKYVLSKLRQIHSKSKWSALIETSEIKLELGSGPKKVKMVGLLWILGHLYILPISVGILDEGSLCRMNQL